ncbi:MAG: sugar ABC transporter permease, partial [Clostridia bacterium]|nr:sugar ABC transporter permease [Clostridia bacterium]
MSTNNGKKEKKSKSGLFKKSSVSSWLFVLPAIILMYLFIWRPTVMGFVWSLFKMNGYTPKAYIGLQNYIEVMRDTQFIPLFANT